MSLGWRKVLPAVTLVHVPTINRITITPRQKKLCLKNDCPQRKFELTVSARMNIFFLFHLCLLFLKKIKIEKLFLLTFCLKLRMRQMLIQKKKCVGKSYFWVSADTAAAELWTLQRVFFVEIQFVE